MKKIIIVFLLFVTSIAFADNENIDMWKFEKEILINEEFEYKSIMLDKEVYKYSNNDLSDIRIVDQNGEFVPYYIESQYEKMGEQKDYYVYYGEEILTFIKNDDVFIDFKLVSDSIEKDFIVNQLDLELDLSRNFAKDIIIYGSYDNEKWHSIKKDKIFNISEENKSKTSLYFDQELKYNYYRISILQNIENIQVESIVAIRMEDVIVEKNDYILQERPEYKTKQEANNTIITILNPNKFKILAIKIFTKDLFHRDYKLELQNGFIFNTGTINSDNNGNVINIYDDYIREESEKLNLTIYNKDDKPIKIDEIVVSYGVDKLVFKANENHEYRMLVGNENARTPSYDITSHKTFIQNEKKEVLVFGNTLEKNIEEPAANNNNMKIILNIVVIVTSLFLIFIIFKSIKKK